MKIIKKQIKNENNTKQTKPNILDKTINDKIIT